MIKILFISTSTKHGGIERVQIEYINYLKQHYDLQVMLENDYGDDNIEENINHQINYIKNKEFVKQLEQRKIEKNNSIIKKIQYNIALWKSSMLIQNVLSNIVKDFHPDIIIDFNGNLSTYKLKSNVKIAFIHSNILKENKKIKKLKNYTNIICVSNALREKLILLFPDFKYNTTTIYNPVDFALIKALSEEEFILDDIELSKKKYLLMVARLAPPKDFDTLIKAFNLSKDNGYDGDLIIIGNGINWNYIQSLATKSLYSKNIHIIGEKLNPYNWMKLCDKFILSSKSEALPTVLIEALSLNNCVISSDCEFGPNEILKNGEIGYLFQPGDYKQLAKYINDAIAIDIAKIDNSLARFNIQTTMQKFNDVIIHNSIMPLVSVVITNYNYGCYIIEAIEAIIHQTYRNWELIIVDDSSTDNSQQIISDYIKCHTDYTKIQFIINENNLGVCATRNNGLKQATGEYIVFLDADDYFRNDFLEQYMKQIKKKNADVVYCQIQTFGSENRFSKMPSPNKYKNIYYSNQLIGPSMFKREVALKIGGYNTKQKSYEDWELWVRLHSNGYTKAAKVNAILLFYRKHGKSLYADGKSNDETLKAQIIMNNTKSYHKYYIKWAEAILNNDTTITNKIKTRLSFMPDFIDLLAYFEKDNWPAIKKELNKKIIPFIRWCKLSRKIIPGIKRKTPNKKIPLNMPDGSIIEIEYIPQDRLVIGHKEI